MGSEHTRSEYSVTVPPGSATVTDIVGVVSLPTYVASAKVPAVTTSRADGGATLPAASSVSRPAAGTAHTAASTAAVMHSMRRFPGPPGFISGKSRPAAPY